MSDLALFRHTPTLSVCSPDGRALRNVVYERTQPNGPALSRVTRTWSSADGRVSRLYDPRLFALSQAEADIPSNLATLRSLSGTNLLNENVDSGWSLAFNGQAGHVLDNWDSRGSHAWMEYDNLLRPVAEREQPQGGTARVRTRFSYAASNSAEAARNRCGRLARVDEDCATVLFPEYRLSGVSIQVSRQWLKRTDLPDWPLELDARDALLRDAPPAITTTRHNALAEQIGQTDARGNVQTIAQTKDGQVQSIRLEPAGGLPTLVASDLRYNAQGQIEQQRFGNGVLSTLVYDPANGLLLQHRSAHPQGSLLQDLMYRRDPLGNIVEINDAAQPIRFFRNQKITARRTFAYDSLYHLINATGFETAGNRPGPDLPDFQSPPDPALLANYSRRYEYDAAGNLSTVRHVGAQNFTHHQVTARLSNRGLNHDANTPPPSEAAINAAFDPNGNLQALRPGQVLSWTLKNQLHQVSQVTRDNGDDAELYRYDYAGMRRLKLRNWQTAQVEHFEEVRYLPSLELRHNSARGEDLHVSIVSTPLGEVRLLHWEAGLPTALSNDQYRYGLADHQRSCGLELDDQARLISQETYYPYGGTAWWAGHSQVQARYKVIRYSGQERDASGLYYYGMRYYAPWLQRWINPDPAGVADGLNLYAMVHGNPVGNVDSQGLVTTAEVARTTLHAALRDASSLFFGALLSIGVGMALDQTVVGDTANLYFTLVVACAAGLAAVRLTYPSGEILTDRLMGTATRLRRVTVGGLVGMAAFVLGSAATLIDIVYPQQDEQGNPIVSQSARALVQSAALNSIYQIVQQLTARVGDRFAWDTRPEFFTSALVTGASAVARGGLSFLGLNQWASLGSGTGVEVAESAIGTLSRSRSHNASLVLGSAANLPTTWGAAVSFGREFLNAMVGRVTTSATIGLARQLTRLLPAVVGQPVHAALGALSNLRTFAVARVAGQSANDNFTLDPATMRAPSNRALTSALPSSRRSSLETVNVISMSRRRASI